MDRISKLPDGIIHEIMRRVPLKEAARTSVLSKVWLRNWCNYLKSNFDISDSDFNVTDSVGDERQLRISQFVNFLSISLQRFVALGNANNHNHGNADMFRLIIDDIEPEIFIPAVEKWVAVAIQRNPRHFEYRQCYFIEYPHKNLCVPRSFSSVSAIQVLVLEACTIPFYEFEFPHLHKLKLFRVYIQGKTLARLTSKSRLIKDIKLNACYDLDSFKLLRANQLNRLVVRSCTELMKIEIEAPSLEELSCSLFTRERRLPFSFAVIAGESLRVMDLTGLNIDDQQLQRLLSSYLPTVEELTLSSMGKKGKIYLSSQKLKILDVTNVSFEAFSIDAPSLVEIKYRYAIVPFLSLESPNLRQIDIEVQIKQDYGFWHSKLEKVLPELYKYVPSLTLVFSTNKVIIVHEDSKGTKLPSPVEIPESFNGNIRVTSASLCNGLKLSGYYGREYLSVSSPTNNVLSKASLIDLFLKNYISQLLPTFDDIELSDSNAKVVLNYYEKIGYETSTFRILKI